MISLQFTRWLHRVFNSAERERVWKRESCQGGDDCDIRGLRWSALWACFVWLYPPSKVLWCNRPLIMNANKIYTQTARACCWKWTAAGPGPGLCQINYDGQSHAALKTNTAKWIKTKLSGYFVNLRSANNNNKKEANARSQPGQPNDSLIWCIKCHFDWIAATELRFSGHFRDEETYLGLILSKSSVFVVAQSVNHSQHTSAVVETQK